MKFRYSLQCVLVTLSMALYGENADEKQEQKPRDYARAQAMLIALERIACKTTNGIIYLGKGMFYVSRVAIPLTAKLLFLTVKAGIETIKIIVDIPQILFKAALLMSGGYVILLALDFAYGLEWFFGTRSQESL